MKINIKNLIIGSILLGSVSMGYAQADVNGRTNATPPNAPTITDEAVHQDQLHPNGSDQDVPGDRRDGNGAVAMTLENLILQELADLEARLLEVEQRNRELELQHAQLQRSLGSCCSDLQIQYARLEQNEPNPFRGMTNVVYHLPEGVNRATLEIRSIEGQLLHTESLDATQRKATLPLRLEQLNVGSYVYYLYVDGQLVDSKVMVAN